MRRNLVFLLTLSMIVAIALGTANPSGVKAADKPALEISWFAWPPCDALGKLVTTYPDATVTVKCPPIGQWHDTIFTDFVAKSGVDLPILDSQWIGEAVKGGHLAELTDWMNGNMDVADYVPSALSAYGEYPPNSKHYWGVAAMADVMDLVYRKDVFQKANIKPPTTWTELLKDAQMIKSQSLAPSGFAEFWCGAAACYDNVQTAWNQIAWSFGGELWNPATYKVDGILNSPENIAALDFAKELYKTGPEGSGNFGFGETVDAICSGKTAMTAIWVGFGPGFLDKKGCAQSDNLSYAVLPGEKKHVLTLGGQGISVSAYTKNKDAALAFLKWFESKDEQLEWIKVGGYSARLSILATDTFLKAAPYNAVFAESYKLVKDFWNLPEYSDMLIVQGEQLNLAITGQEDSKTALDNIAKAQQAILDKAYPDGPPKGVSAVTNLNATMAATASK